ncbi:beta and beta-prime subunits of DNA dependent RNA-polymerase [Aaosphaeria arxii CBS 175.79]|uniref:DNA-directed RNA polymerase subunit beta n=1 Tax=Aaosphaeria arxii CBS 175.79 TaxID=1450172 RepID=A0A6A5XHN8_9PLEO|nr:beta and beta-prime subunits of DNA dependent RNA-polymerase [Aaosphaeria arxii CBS 175.79]KAF2012366.1 beta and beta-prime subunits of DNA dependent RNA-polymerase [Aaosphaeria arxii CBS 175.79]
MAPAATTTSTDWSVDYNNKRRQELFRSPPKDKTAYPTLAAAVDPHINSFNSIFAEGGQLEQGIKDIGTKIFLDGDLNVQPEDAGERNRFYVRIQKVFLDQSTLPPSNKFAIKDHRLVLPAECRERHSTYRGKLTARIEWKVNNGDWQEEVRELGYVPIMLRSNRCHLQGMSPAQLVEAKEESEELGGYFIVNGIEKLIRMLQVNRRNYPMAIKRGAFTNRGPGYTPYGIVMRCVRPDQTSQTNALHYLNDGNVNLRFSWRKAEYLVPVMMILKALVETNDREIFEGIIGAAGSEGLTERQFVTDRLELLLRTYKVYGLHSKAKTRAYLGRKFKIILQIPQDVTDEEAGTEFLRRIVLPHLGSTHVTESQNADKFRMLLFMIRKLYALVEGECAVDNPDAVSNQEVLLGGHLFGMILKEKLDEWLNSLSFPLRDWLRKTGSSFTSQQFHSDLRSQIFKRTNENIGQAMDYFMSTGNLVSPTGLDLQQASGFTVVAEKINFYRFISHFRMVHRGAFFAQLKTTTVRKLLPESWGFLCPVHTPDGSPCGLLNHLAHKCKIATQSVDVSAIPKLVAQLGVSNKSSASLEFSVVVQLDGRVLGYCSPKQAKVIADTLRYWKVEGTHNVPVELEIGYIPNSTGGQYPGVYMFSQSARMYRPVKYLPLDKLDYVGPFEQPFMSIACTDPEIVSGDSTHVEYDPTNILSILANMTPFSDFNQSPRNMYQCQMGKQSMGTPGTAMRYRTDNKTYRLQTGQTPIVRPPLHNEYGLDNFPNGTNAVVAVISYTGYDMDDAMILNKSAHERGFGHGTIYKTKICDLEEGQRRGRSSKHVTRLFGFAPGGLVTAAWREKLDDDGWPRVGTELRHGDVIAAWHNVSYDPSTGEYVNRDGQTQLFKYKEDEVAFVEEVRIIGSESGTEPCQKISVKLRVPRSPVIGDKFSSRHGQKGVCSQKWPAIDMPFSESGMQPDVIINPHAFPSRMTIGMFVESMAGKSGALHGLAQDSTPFRFDEQNTAVDHFGHQLMKAGYNYYGNEPMYSGITGQELAADIYIGVVYYQRLRHMVNDKYQVRTTGPVNSLTGQPIKGRKKGGGIRVGEMERDALLAHGTAFLLQDRLMNCSDYTKAAVCRACGSFLSTAPTVTEFTRKKKGTPIVRCRRCARLSAGSESKSDTWVDGQGIRFTGGDDIAVVAVPGVLKYLDVELASMGIRLKFRVEP